MPIKNTVLLVKDNIAVGTGNYESTGEFSTCSEPVPVRITNSDGTEEVGSVRLKGARKDHEGYARNGDTFAVTDVLLQNADGKHSVSINLFDDLGIKARILLPLNEKGEIRFDSADRNNLSALSHSIGLAYDNRPCDTGFYPLKSSQTDIRKLPLPSLDERMAWEHCTERAAGLPNTPSIVSEAKRGTGH
jgi:hypothetical protein